MRRSAPLLLLALGLTLAACGAPPVRLADVPDFGEVKAVFALGQDVQVINVRALDRIAITGAELVMPDGTRVPAYSIEQQKDPTLSDRTGLGAAESNVTGMGGPVPLLTGPGVMEGRTIYSGQVASVALIRVPELAAYREVWQASKIEVHLGFAPDERVQTLAAPQPG